MGKIITLSREFGSGGRELGYLLARELGLAYYDKEILDAMARETNMDSRYIERVLDKGVKAPLHFGRSFVQYSTPTQSTVKLLVIQQGIIKELANSGDCLIVGRGANAILEGENPFSIFVYADMARRIARCKSRGAAGENLSYKEVKGKIKEIDGARAKELDIISGQKWGRKENYRLCLDTGGVDIKSLVPAVAHYAKAWWEAQEK